MSDRQITSGKRQIMNRLGIAFLTWRRYVRKYLTPFGITLKQAFVLGRLAEREYLLPSRIASLLFCDRPTATVVIRNMGRHGWVDRRRDPDDRRRIQITITDRGREKLAEIYKSAWEPLASAFDPLACFEEEELAELDRLLTKLHVHLRQIR